MRPLDGITVVALEQAVAAPYATRQLADLGARVIKIERPDGGDFARHYDETVHGLSSYFVWVNRSKESLALDVKDPRGFAVLSRLLDGADVFIHNLGPGAAERLGLDARSLQPRYPQLIHCSISGFGQTGSDAHRKAYDLLVQAEAGLLAVTGTATDVARVGISIADIAAGMYAYSGILSALIQRGRTGEGTTVEVSLFEALAEWMGNPAYYTMYGGTAPERVGAAHATIAPYGVFPTLDGQIMLAVQNDREWEAFCAKVLAQPELAQHDSFRSNPQRCAHRAELDAAIGAHLATRSFEEAERALTDAGIANARVNDMAAFLEHPALSSRGRWTEVGTPGGPIRALLPPASIGGVEPMMGDVPALGAHTDALLAEFGVAQQDIAALYSTGTVAGAQTKGKF